MSVLRYKPVTKAKPRGKPFKKGGGKFAGRTKGTPNKTTKLLKDAITGSAEKLGMLEPVYKTVKGRNGRSFRTDTIIGWKPSGKGDMEGYLTWLGIHYPRSYSVLLGRLLPLQINAKVDTPPTVAEKFKGVDFKSMTLDEKMAAMKEMTGLTQPLPALSKPGDSANVVDGEFTEVGEEVR